MLTQDELDDARETKLNQMYSQNKTDRQTRIQFETNKWGGENAKKLFVYHLRSCVKLHTGKDCTYGMEIFDDDFSSRIQNIICQNSSNSQKIENEIFDMIEKHASNIGSQILFNNFIQKRKQNMENGVSLRSDLPLFEYAHNRGHEQNMTLNLVSTRAKNDMRIINDCLT